MMKLRFIERGECGSTNDEAWAEWANLAPAGREGVAIAVLAQAQTRGRGRQGRTWEGGTPGANLILSLATLPPPRNLTWLPLAAGVAAVEAVRAVCAGIAKPGTLENLRLKWPNDVLLDAPQGSAKLGGILCETRFGGDRATGAVIGIGLNLAESPRLEDGTPTASLSIAPFPAELRLKLARAFCETTLSWIKKLADGRTAGLRETWKRMAKLDRHPEFDTHDDAGNSVTLRMVDLDGAGRLIAEARDTNSLTPKLVTLDQP